MLVFLILRRTAVNQRKKKLLKGKIWMYNFFVNAYRMIAMKVMQV